MHHAITSLAPSRSKPAPASAIEFVVRGSFVANERGERVQAIYSQAVVLEILKFPSLINVALN
jgi:hypothetical protein